MIEWLNVFNQNGHLISDPPGLLSLGFISPHAFRIPSGVEILKQYKAEVDKYEADRQELANAEKLFDLPITMYPDLLQVQKETKGLEQIYALYEEQKVRLCTEKCPLVTILVFILIIYIMNDTDNCCLETLHLHKGIILVYVNCSDLCKYW